MSWGVDNVEAILLRHVLLILLLGLGPETSDSSGSNSDTALALLLHPVSGGFTFVNLTNFVLRAGVKEHAFRRSSLASVHVGDDAEVAHFLEGVIALHRGNK